VQAVRVLGAVLGLLLALLTTASVVRNLVIPRSRPGGVARAVDRAVDKAFRLATRRCSSYESRDGILAAQAAVYLIAVLVTWLASYLVAFALQLWPLTHHLGGAFRESASSLLTLGFDSTIRVAPTALDTLAALAGLVVIAVQIAYLPTLYAAFNRRETEVTLLGARAGTPPWGPELLARTRYGMRTRTDDLPDFYAGWERWAADVAESHANYPVLVRFRSPQPLSSWLVGLLAVLDSAAMHLALCPSQERYETRACLRMGFTALRQIGVALGLRVDFDPDPDVPLTLTYDEFRQGVARLEEVGFPIERTAEDAWPHFRGWRVNYESLAYAVAEATDAVPALWSGPRRWSHEPMPPQRPPTRVASDAR
jgi:hypothetical protein